MRKKVFKILKRLVFILLLLVLASGVTTFFYMKQAKFGKLANGDRLERIKKSPNYRDGSFQNINYTPELTEGYSMGAVLYDFFFKKHPGKKPVDTIPSMKTDLLNLSPDQDILVWFGHSSYFIQIDGKKILVDPVFSGNASPVPGTTKSFKGTDRYTVDDLPDIDYLFISHDHYDHADYETLIKLRSKTKNVFCGLGVGAHLEHWGYDIKNIFENDWNETIDLGNGFVVNTTPTRHFSGRGFSRNKSLWLSYVLQTPSMRIYIGGDSGYDTHFAEIGKKFGPFDLAMLEDGQYDVKWKYIHMLPEEVLKAAKDLNTKRLFPVHSSKFALGNHPWNEPLTRITELNKSINIPLITPIIGETVNLKDESQQFKQWWVGIK